jgi:transposase-like protein
VGAAVHAVVDRGSPAVSACGRGSLFVDETYVKVAAVWSYVYRAVDQHGQVIDAYVSRRRDSPPRGGSSPLR